MFRITSVARSVALPLRSSAVATAALRPYAPAATCVRSLCVSAEDSSEAAAARVSRSSNFRKVSGFLLRKFEESDDPITIDAINADAIYNTIKGILVSLTQ